MAAGINEWPDVDTSGQSKH